MPPLTEVTFVKVTVSDRDSMDQHLDAAEAAILNTALERRDSGILVTRHSADTFTVELSPEVPYGLTLERCLF